MMLLFFNSLEMRSRHANTSFLTRDFGERYLGYIAWIGNGFGANLMQPLVATFFIWLVFSGIYYCTWKYSGNL